MKKLLLFVVVLFVSMGAAYSISSWREWREEKVQPLEIDASISLPEEEEIRIDRKLEVKIYFPSPDSRYLRAEDRVVTFVREPQKFTSVIIDELLKGPLKGGYTTIPDGTKLLDVYFVNRVAYLDFSSQLKQKHVSGSWTEVLTIYSIVNTVLANVENADRVFILINGSESDTLGGHISLDIEFAADTEMMEKDSS